MSFIDTKSFVDSNIICYMFDNANPEKRKKANELILMLEAGKSINVSTQVLQESFNVLTKKLGYSSENAKLFLRKIAAFNVVQVTVKLIFYAIDISANYRISFWDSLIVAAAQKSNCKILYSEDLNNGEIIEGVKIVNPFLM